jgi:hypothetical protein
MHVVTDNIGVSAFSTFKVSNPRERRLLAYLQQFQLYIHYCKGSKHISADNLSRLPAELPAAERVSWSKSTQADDRIIDDYLFSVSDQVQDNDIMRQSSNASERQWTVYEMNDPMHDSCTTISAIQKQNQSDEVRTPSGHGCVNKTTPHAVEQSTNTGLATSA